jgi:DNA polymerase III delta subunit
MTIFLYGPDDYRREEKKRWYAEEFRKKYSGLSAGVFDLLEDGALENLKTFLRSESLFEEKKLAIIENLYEADEKTVLETLRPLVAKKATARGVPNRTIVVCSERKKPVKAFDALLEKPSIVEVFEYLMGSSWLAFIRAETKKSGIAFDAAAVQFLADVYQGNTWGFVTELQKLDGFPKRIITREDLDMLGLEAAPNYWTILNNLKSGEVRNRLWALEKMLAMGDPAPKIFNILASQWREKTAQMAEYDLKVKSGKLDYEEALVDLVL